MVLLKTDEAKLRTRTEPGLRAGTRIRRARPLPEVPAVAIVMSHWFSVVQRSNRCAGGIARSAHSAHFRRKLLRAGNLLAALRIG